MDSTNNQAQPAHSSFVTVLAWVFIVLCGFATFISLAQNIMIHTVFPVEQMRAAMQSAKEKQNMPPFAEFMFSHIQWLFGVFLVISASTLASSIALLKRRNWARLFFIFILSCGIIWNIGGLFLQQAMFSSMPPPPPTASPEFQAQFNSMATTMSVFSAVMAIGLSVLFAWIIRKLVSSATREEFEVNP